MLNTNVGSNDPAEFTGNVVGDVSGAVGSGNGVSIFSEWNSIYIGSDPSETTVTNATPGAKNNLSLGKVTLSVVTTGDKNTAIGHAALKVLTTGYNNNSIGYQAGNKLTTGFNNDFLGFQAGTKVTTGQENVLIGRQSGYNLTTGKWNVFVGKNAGAVIKTGQQNTIIGNGANVTSGNTGAVNRTAIGAGAIASTNNTVVLGNTNAANELWVGTSKQGDVFATDGNFSGTITGDLTGNVTGGLTGNVTGNVTGDLTGNVTGNVTGDLTGNADTVTAYSNDGTNFSLGSGATSAAQMTTLGYSNSGVIGVGAAPSGYTGSVYVGNSSLTYVMMGSNLQGRGVGAGFLTVSDKRFKSNILPLESSLSKISQISGKRYYNNLSKSNDIGLIAQEIKEIYPELVHSLDKVNGESRYAVNYTGFVPVLINAINEQKIIIDELQEKVDEIDELKEELENLKQLIMNNN